MKDIRLFGLFPEFQSFLDRDAVVQAALELKTLDRGTAAGITQTIPNEWEVEPKAADALVDLILGRANFVAETIETRLWPQGQFALDNGDDEESEA